jgi:hypothetical protein
MIDDLDGIQKQCDLEEAEEPEPGSKGRTVVVLKLTEEHGLIDAGIKLFEGIDSNTQQSVTYRQGIMRMLALKSSLVTPA